MFGVILAGGSGTRFWPKSRKKCPKQLINISPEHEETMIELTVDRIAPVVSETFIITNVAHIEKTRELLGDSVSALVAEPAARNTAAAVGLAALLLARIDPNGVMAVFPADHIILDVEAFHRELKAARASALEGNLVTFGIKPDHPETGYGYIQAATEGKAGTSCRSVVCFKEKPDLKTAKEYLAAGNYFWNSGMFVWKVSTIIEEMEAFMPDLLIGLKNIVSKMDDKSYDLSALASEYAALQSTSIDYGIMERSSRVVVLPVDIGWNDVGCWSALDDITKNKDENGNVLLGKVLPLQTENCIIQSNGKMVATLGLKDIIVVETPDVILVCNKNNAQDVKTIVEELKTRDWNEYL